MIDVSTTTGEYYEEFVNLGRRRCWAYVAKNDPSYRTIDCYGQSSIAYKDKYLYAVLQIYIGNPQSRAGADWMYLYWTTDPSYTDKIPDIKGGKFEEAKKGRVIYMSKNKI